jgi:AcrR family transcriptional regulator
VNILFTIEKVLALAQVLKEDVQRRILAAGLASFATRGFRATTMASVASAAAVATGNIYRYYENKDVLFAAAVPPGIARELSQLVRGRVRAMAGSREVARSTAWRLASERLIAFTLEHRLATVVLLTPGRADGTPLAGFSERMVAELVALAVEHASSIGAPFELDDARRFALDRIYRGLLATMASALLASTDEVVIRASIEAYSRYHLAGMKAFLEGDGS